MLVYICLITPYRIGLYVDATGFLYWFEFTLDIFFIVDIFFQVYIMTDIELHQTIKFIYKTDYVV